MFMAGSTCHVGGGTAEKDPAKSAGPVQNVLILSLANDVRGIIMPLKGL
jgi:hypothetical protein